jgi:hypothetical protein
LDDTIFAIRSSSITITRSDLTATPEGNAMNVLIAHSSDEDPQNLTEFLAEISAGADGTPDYPRFPNLQLSCKQCNTNATGFFRAFADAAPTAKGLDSLWEKYGGPDADLVDVAFKGADEPPTFVMAETKSARPALVATWLEHQRAMNRAVRLWDLAGAASGEQGRGGLSDYVKWREVDGGIGVVVEEEAGGGRKSVTKIASPRHRQELLIQILRPGDLVVPALLYVQAVVNERLPGLTESRVLYHPRERRLRVHLVPKGLLGFLWLQFADALAGGKRFGRCRECQTWFAVGPGEARKSRLYCADPCVLAAYRKRKQDAIRLAGEGKTVAEIAKELDWDAGSIRKWTKPVKQKVPKQSRGQLKHGDEAE